jgi:hypothetical protein
MSAGSPHPCLHTGESSTQSDERSTTRSAQVAPAPRLPQQQNVLPVVQRIVLPTPAHTGPDTLASQRSRSPIQIRFRITSGMHNRPQVNRPVVQATRAIHSTSERRSGQNPSNSAQRPSNNSIHQSNSTPTGTGVAPPSVSHDPFGEEFHRAFEVFSQALFQNRGSTMTSGSANAGVPGVEVHMGSLTTSVNGRLVSQHGPSTSTTARFDDLPPDVRSGVMRVMELASNVTGQNFNQVAQPQEAPASSRSRHLTGGPVINSARLRQELATAEDTVLEASHRFHALNQQVAATAEEFRTLLQRLAPPPAHIEHFTTLPADDLAIEPDCIICQEPYNNNEHAAIQLRNVTCTHIFGRTCLQKWVNSRMANSHRCPSCRQDISGALARAAPTPQSAPVNDHEVSSGRPVRSSYTHMLRELNHFHQADREESTRQAITEDRIRVLEARSAAFEVENRADALIGDIIATTTYILRRTATPQLQERTNSGESVARSANERNASAIQLIEQSRSVSRRAAREIQELEAEDAILRH